MNAAELTSIITVVMQLGLQAVVAAHAAQGIPITPESVAALMPDQTPLSAPDA